MPRTFSRLFMPGIINDVNEDVVLPLDEDDEPPDADDPPPLPCPLPLPLWPLTVTLLSTFSA